MNTSYKKSRSKTPNAERNNAQPVQGNINQEDVGNQATLKMMEAAKRFDAGHGTELNMPEELKARMENHFGMSLSGIKLRESSQVRDMGTTAVARGDTVSFAPGVYNPGTRIGREIIGHEIAHVVQQASGKAEANLPGVAISLDQGLEHAADHEGSMAVMDTGSDMEIAQPMMPLVALAPESAPMQGKNWLKSLWGYITGKDKKEEIKTRDRAVTMISGRPPVFETAEDKAPSSPDTETEAPTPIPEAEPDIAPPPIPEAEPDIAPPPPPESETDIPPPPPPESETDIPPPPLPEAEMDIPPPPLPEAEAESMTTTTVAAPEQAAETTDASGSASPRGVSSVGLPTGGKVWEDAGQYIKSRDREFANILDLLNAFHHTIDTVRLPAVPAQDADKTSFLQRIGEANTIVMTAYNEALDALMKYSTTHSNDKDKNKRTLATYAIQYYMIGDTEKIRTQSIYDAMQRAVAEESPTGGQADFNELAGKTYREAISSMGVFVSRAKPIKQMSGGINTVDFVSTGENRTGVLKRGQRELFVSGKESEILHYLINNVTNEELEKIKASSFESLVEEYGFEGAQVLVKYRNLSREQLMKATSSMTTAEDVFRFRLGKETNVSRQDKATPSYEVKDANTSHRDVAVSRINKLLGFDIITETEFAQTEDRTKSSIGKKAEGEQAVNLVYYVGAQNAGVAGVLSTLQAISEYCKARASISNNSALGEEEKERALESTGINAPVETIDLGRAGNALQMIKLSVIDMIVGHVDRHVGNFMVQPGEDGTMTMRGIDNDTAFGLFDDISGESEERKKVDKSRLTPFLSDTLPFVPRSIYESVTRVDSSMISGALTGLLSDEEIQFTESRFEKVKAHMEQLAAQNKIKEPNEQDVAELARPKDKRYARTNYMSELLAGQSDMERALSTEIRVGVFMNSGFANIEEMKQAVQSLQVNGIDPIELVRAKKAFTKDIVKDALLAKQSSASS